MYSAYNLVHIRPKNKWKMTFSTASGHYEYWEMPYGLSCAPSIFQNLMNNVLRDILSWFVIAYIDDILIYSLQWRTIVEHIKKMLAQL